VLLYWLSGTTDRKAEIKNKGLARIIAKCTALEPNARFQNAAALRKSLRNYKHRNLRRSLAAAAVCALAACLVFIVASMLNNPIAEPTILEIEAPQPEIETPPEEPPAPVFLDIGSAEFREFAENGVSNFLLSSGYREGSPAFEYVEGEGLRVTNSYIFSHGVYLNVSAIPPGRYFLEIELDTGYDYSDEFFRLSIVYPYMNTIAFFENTLMYNLVIEEVDGMNMANVLSASGQQYFQRVLGLQRNPFIYPPRESYPDYTIKSIRIHNQDPLAPAPVLITSSIEERLTETRALWEERRLREEATAIFGDIAANRPFETDDVEIFRAHDGNIWIMWFAGMGRDGHFSHIASGNEGDTITFSATLILDEIPDGVSGSMVIQGFNNLTEETPLVRGEPITFTLTETLTNPMQRWGATIITDHPGALDWENEGTWNIYSASVSVEIN
jgi:hypothetical protein